MTPAKSRGDGSERVLVVGSGTRFISGISHHTRYVALALAERAQVSVILMRQLIPRMFYPGRARVGEQLTDASYPREVPVFDGVDWYWLPSIFRALRFLRRQRPDAVVFQWWTGAVLHTYAVLALAAKFQGAKIIIEIHEMQDSGEAGIPLARVYVTRLGQWLMSMADAYVVHSEFDRSALPQHFAVGDRPASVARVGPYTHYGVTSTSALREAPEEACNILFFGTIRPYKGLEDLVRAFEGLADAEPEQHWLTVVGETWEDWSEPTELIKNSRHRKRITLINRYVSDADASRWLLGADVMALPYTRSSASGPLHMAMEAGLPLVVTDVGGLGEATAGYEGAVLVPPSDPTALGEALRTASGFRGQRFDDSSSWATNAESVLAMLDEIQGER